MHIRVNSANAQCRHETIHLLGRMAFQTLLKSAIRGNKSMITSTTSGLEDLRRREASGNDGVADRLEGGGDVDQNPLTNYTREQWREESQRIILHIINSPPSLHGAGA